MVSFLLSHTEGTVCYDYGVLIESRLDVPRQRMITDTRYKFRQYTRRSSS